MLITLNLGAEQKPSALYQLVFKKAATQDYEAAIDILQKLITADSSQTMAYIWLADYYYYAKTLSKGKQYFTTAIESGRDFANAHLALAQIYHYENDLPGVFKQSQIALQKGSDSYKALELFLNTAIRLQKKNALAAQLRKLRKNTTQAHLYDLGYTIWRIKNREYKKAKRTVENYLLKHPDDSYGRMQLGIILQAQGRKAAAGAEFFQALQQVPHSLQKRKINLMLKLSGLFFETGKVDSAQIYVNLARSLGNSAGALVEQLQIALFARNYFRKNSLYNALDNNCRKAIEVLHRLEEKRGLADFYEDRAFCLSLFGDKEESIYYYESAYKIAEGKFARQAEFSFAIGELLQKAGELDKAESYFMRTRQKAEKAGKQELMHRAILRSAEILAKNGEKQPAKRAIEKVLRFSQRNQQHFLTEQCFIKLAYIYLEAPVDYGKANYYLALADALSRQTFKLRYAANHRWMQGNIALQQRDIEQAETLFLDAIQLGKETGAYLAVLAGEAGLVRTYLAANFPDMASTHSDTAFTILNNYYPLCLDEFWAEYFDLKHDLFDPAINAYSHIGDLDKIYAACDRYKAFEYVKAISGLARVTNNSEINSVTRQLASSAVQIRQAWASLWSDQHENQEVELKTKRKIQKNHADRVRMLQELVKKHPQYYQLLRPNIRPLGELQSQLASLNSTFIHYFVGENATFVLVVQPGAIYCKRVNISSAFIDELVSSITPFVSGVYHKSTPNYNSAQPEFRLDRAGRLYELLVEPIEAWLSPQSILIISTDAALNRLPFELLVTNQRNIIDRNDYTNARFMVETYAISYLPFSIFIKPNPQRKPEKKVLLFMSSPAKTDTDPPTNGMATNNLSGQSKNKTAQIELEGINQALGRRHVKRLQQTSATKELCLEQGLCYRILHLAVPSIIEGRNPLSSVIQFAGGNKLSVYELFEAKLNAELVVLSNSKYNPGNLGKSYGMAGLLHGFDFAGVPSMVVSLWHVNAANRKEIFKSFYTNLKSGLNKAEALQKAKINYLKQGNRNPFYWANLVLSGSAKPMKFETKQTYLLVYMTIIGFLILVTLFVYQFHKILKERESAEGRGESGEVEFISTFIRRGPLILFFEALDAAKHSMGNFILKFSRS